jgi:Rad3-related DNA helicase
MGAQDVEDRILIHDTKSREKVFHYFEHSPGNHILISPSATTGVDWDFVTWQMIPKVPYSDLGDEYVRLRYGYVTPQGEALGKAVYQQEAAVALVQACGRCVRTPTSKGTTVITDSAFWPLFKYTAPAAFPAWFRPAVQWYTP